MLTIDPKEIPHRKLHGYMQGAVIPRPIAFVSSMDRNGKVNLSPFSFFNVFSTNPPILVFSPSRKGRDNTTKHTYENVKEVPEVVINVVSYSMVEQASLTSVEFPKGVNEFDKAGFTEVASIKVKPPRVGESKISMECKVNQVIELGTEGGAGNLVICEVLLMHIQDDVLDEHGLIDPEKLDAVARMGGDYYLRVHGENILTIPKPSDEPAIGFDQIPEAIRNSTVLTGNDLGRLGNIQALPSPESVQEFSTSEAIISVQKQGTEAVHRFAQNLLKEGKLEEAWKALLSASPLPPLEGERGR